MNTSEIIAEVRQAAEKFPEKIAVIAGEQQISYSELIRRAQSAGAYVAKQAAGENDLDPLINIAFIRIRNIFERPFQFSAFFTDRDHIQCKSWKHLYVF